MFRLRRKKQLSFPQETLCYWMQQWKERGEALYQHKLGNTCKIPVIFLSNTRDLRRLYRRYLQYGDSYFLNSVQT